MCDTHLCDWCLTRTQCTSHEQNSRITRALSSTKPSARCMAFKLHDSTVACRKGAAKGLEPGPDRDEANVILSQQRYSRRFNSS